MNDFESDWISWSQSFEQNGWIQYGRIQDGRIQDGWHHHVKWEWMSLSQIELTWVRVLCKMAESEMAEFKIEEFKMVAIIKLIRLNKFESESEWRKSVFEWIWEKMTRCLNLRWQCLNPTCQNSRWLPSSSSVRMNEWSIFSAKWLNPRWLPSSS